MNGIGWLTVAEAARLCGTDELRITLWMNGNHIAYARFDDILMIDGSSLAALFGRHRVTTIYDEVPRERGKPGRPGRLRRLLDTPLDTFGLSQRIVRACRELGIFTVEHLLVHLRRFRFSRLSCVRNFGSGSATETLRRLRQDGLIDNGTPRDFKVLYP
ncbi:DNA-binding protein [Bacteroides fragilis]|nr:DNA-binding protein [Bacteroides fragilis]